MKVPTNLYYTKEHEWARVEGDRVIIGITDYAQEQLGDIVYLEFPVEGDHITAKQPFGVVESVKAVTDLNAPVSGEVLEVNNEMLDHPEWVNQGPYDMAWMIAVTFENPDDLKGLMNPEAYEKYLSEVRE